VKSNLVRLSGLAAMLGGVLWALWAGVEQSVGWGELGSAAYDLYEFVNRLLPIALLPVIVGFIGLHAAQRRSYGWLGRAGLVTVIVGFMLIIAGSVGEFWVFSEQAYAMPNGRDASWMLFLIGHLVLAVGTLLFGIASTRAGVLPHDAAMMFAVLGTCGALVPFIGAFIFAIPFAWLGYLLWSGKYEKDQQPSRAS
jgi:hypothetical protein